MTILVNALPETIDQPCRVSDLLRKINLTYKQGIAVALNNEVIPRKDWELQELKENDKITIIKATQGG